MRAMKTEQELKRLAMDIFEGRVFTDRHLDRPESMHLVFMVLIFMKKEDIEALQAEGASLFYEYMDKAGPRAINGMPSFMSMQYITKAEEVIMWEAYDRLKKIKEEFMGPPEEPRAGERRVVQEEEDEGT